jgi:hypothetical protein
VSIISHTIILVAAIAAVVILDIHGGPIDTAGIGLIGAIAGVTGTSLFNQISVNPDIPTHSPPTMPTATEVAQELLKHE